MSTEYPLPDAGKNRFWHGRHQPRNSKQPLLLELREKINEKGPALVSMSTLVSQAGTIADAKAVAETAAEILIRAGEVDRSVGILGEEG